jgi:hypothetical protein
LFGLSKSLAAKTRGDNDRGRPQCTHHSDHHNLPVVAGDCLLALPITLRRQAEMHADSNPAVIKAAGNMFSVLVKFETFTKHILSQWPAALFR